MKTAVGCRDLLFTEHLRLLSRRFYSFSAGLAGLGRAFAGAVILDMVRLLLRTIDVGVSWV